MIRQALRSLIAAAPWPETAGRAAAFEAFYTAHRGLVRRVAYGLGGAEDLDDIVQEAFVRAWRAWDGFEGRASGKTWVYRITLNAARDHWRKRGRYKAALARYAAEPASAAMEPAPGLERALEAALAGLSPDHREAVTLCYLEGLSLAEAAEACGAPLGTLKSRLHHARQRLAQALGAPDRGR